MSTDIELVTRIQQGDEHASQELYLSYVQKLHNYFYWRVYDTSLSEELLSATRCDIFENMGTFDVTISENVSGWMYRIAHNNLVDHIRKQKEQYTLDEMSPYISYDERLIDQVDAKHILEKITETLETIHPHAKDIVLMKLWENMSHTEIAEALHISQANSKKIFSRSLHYLRETYGDTFILLLISLTNVC